MKKYLSFVLLLASFSGLGFAKSDIIKNETTKFKVMVDSISERLSIEEAEKILDDRENMSIDERTYSPIEEAKTFAAKLVLANLQPMGPTYPSCQLTTPCGQKCGPGGTGQGFFCTWGSSCNGFGQCQNVNAPNGG